jgi:two-component system NtrC family sensor kinase
MGLRPRLFLLVVLPIALVVGAYGAVRIRQETNDAVEAERRQAATAARAVQVAIELPLQDRRFADVERLVADLVTGHEAIERIRVVDRDLKELALDPRGGASPGPEGDVRAVIQSGRPLERADEHGTIRFVLPLHGQGGRVIGAAEVTFLAARQAREVARIAADVALRLGILVLALGLLTSLALARQVIRPLQRLAASIRALGEGRPGPPLPVTRRDELGAVAGAFNHMVEQLDAARAALETEAQHAIGLERQLRRAETLAVAGKLTSALAHEVGTPLNIISGRAELALGMLGPDDPARDELATIVNQTERISGIIRSLLDSVRTQKPEIRPVAIAPLVSQITRLITHDAECRGLQIEAPVPDGLPAVAADSGQLQQVLLNLLVNALDATPVGGRISVQAGACRHDGRAGVAVTVSDSGPGIPREHLGRIFDPFFTTKPPGRGTGLGLAICRDILREHGGTLTAQTRDGRGATFTLWLPAHPEAR